MSFDEIYTRNKIHDRRIFTTWFTCATHAIATFQQLVFVSSSWGAESKISALGKCSCVYDYGKYY